MFYHTFFDFFLASLLLTAIFGVYFSFQKKSFIKNYKQADTKILENINGMIITENGPLRKSFQWCSFDIMINQNSIFLFPKSFYFLPKRAIQLIYSNSDKKHSKFTTLLRQLNISKNNVELISNPNYLFAGTRKILLKELNNEQILIFEDIKKSKNY
ncbi:hypothetical protein SAMN05421664_0617 [Chryseobacterium soldanellicola]|uniref:GRAM domain-containing protein n=1 Tax=Chryseobacterium soldanellicola TaxID=311333 RepID=A0A1H0YB82_9FLAO|nr:hypothetical protein SAMN05421664_0617 [Chryseobacterium soldanellicola]